MVDSARMTLSDMGKDLGIIPDDIRRLKSERRRRKWAFGVIAIISGVASFLLGTALSETITPRRSYPFAAALPLLSSSTRRRAGVLGIVLVSIASFVLGYLIIQWQLKPIHAANTFYGVFSR
jgi:hypothetical protein